MTFLEMNELILPEFEKNKDVWEDCAYYKKQLPEFEKYNKVWEWEDEYRENKDVWENYTKYKNTLYTREFHPVDEDEIIKLRYPGKKTRYKEDGSIIYDYLVEFKGDAITHKEIIVNLYNRVSQQPDSSDKQDFAKDLIEFLITLAREAVSIPSLFLELGGNLPPSRALLAKTKSHIDYSFSFQELATLIPWISLQEDINYPMNERRKRDNEFNEGRKMCFKRYLEAVYTATEEGQNSHSIYEVIKRSYGPQDDWLNDDYLKPAYSAINAIGEVAEEVTEEAPIDNQTILWTLSYDE